MLRDAARGVYKRVVVQRRPLVGAVLYGDTARRRLVFRPAEDAARTSAPIRDMLIFGQAFASGGGRRGP